MVEKYDSILHNIVWDVVPRLKDKSMVSSHWIYKVKKATYGSVEKHKAIFVARGFSQGKYANEILKRLCMESRKPMETPLAGNWRKEDATLRELVEAIVCRKLMGSVMYLVNTRPDMCYAVNPLSQVMVRPTKMYWKVAKHVLIYLKGTSKYGLWYIQTWGVNNKGFTDAYWVGSPFVRESTPGGIFSIGSVVVSWYNRKQRSIALSLTEAEYMVASQVACEAIWMRNILVGLFGKQMDPTVIYYHNQSCIKLSKNPIFHDRSKHIVI
eukprot:PITA_31397